jgi:Ca2+-transporting ATPase
MVTGDHPATARAMAREVGIEGDEVLTHADLAALSPEQLSRAARTVNLFARVSPEDKLRLVEALQANGEIVAVTGDGVNDAPALKRSDVGVAMGRRGTDVAREVADLVLLDDNFSTIVAAVEEGRSIFRNIQKFTRFLFSTNLAEVLVVAIGSALAWGLGLRDADGSWFLPLTATQILWINLVTDGMPALALSLDRNPGVLEAAPRDPKAPLLDRPTRIYVAGSGILCAVFGLAILGLVAWLGHSMDAARTALFAYLAAVQLFLAYVARKLEDRPPRNLALHAALVLGLGLIALPLGVGALRAMFGAVPLAPPVYAAIAVAILGSVWGTVIIGRRLWTLPPKSRPAAALSSRSIGP